MLLYTNYPELFTEFQSKSDLTEFLNHNSNLKILDVESITSFAPFKHLKLTTDTTTSYITKDLKAEYIWQMQPFSFIEYFEKSREVFLQEELKNTVALVQDLNNNKMDDAVLTCKLTLTHSDDYQSVFEVLKNHISTINAVSSNQKAKIISICSELFINFNMHGSVSDCLLIEIYAKNFNFYPKDEKNMRKLIIVRSKENRCSLKKSDVEGSIIRGMNGEVRLEGKGGAGIGFYCLYAKCNGMIIRAQSAVQTEFDLIISPRSFKSIKRFLFTYWKDYHKKT